MKTKLIILAALCGTLQAQTIWQFDATRAALKKDEEGIAFAREFARTNTNPSMMANASWSGIIWKPKKGDRELGYADNGTVLWRLVPESNMIPDATNYIDWITAVTATCTNTLSAYDTNQIYRLDAYGMFRKHDTASEIKRLSESGEVCATMGHQWKQDESVYAHYPEDKIPERRVCGLCGMKQAKEVKEEWK